MVNGEEIDFLGLLRHKINTFAIYSDYYEIAQYIFIVTLLLFISPYSFANWEAEISVGASQFYSNSEVSPDEFYAVTEWTVKYESENETGDRFFKFSPEFYIDISNGERSYVDLQELNWIFSDGNQEVRAGIRVVTWQTTESAHLVDVINQTNLLKGFDGEDKLGQPMLNYLYSSRLGQFEVYILPGFRERKFPEEDSRYSFVGNVGSVEFESSAEKFRTDFAFRWSLSIDGSDIALSHFSGTNREPLLLFGEDQLTAFYPTIDQTGFEYLHVFDGWIWKLEAISRSEMGQRFQSAVFGFEYTYSGLWDGQLDIGALAEYLYSDKKEDSELGALSDDYFFGFRITENSIAGTNFLSGVIYDFDSQEYFLLLEVDWRVNENLTIEIESRAFGRLKGNGDVTGAHDLAERVFNDDFLRVNLTWYF